MSMVKQIVICTLFLTVIFSPAFVHADSGCDTLYSTCTPSQSIIVDKTVGKVVVNADSSTSLIYVDNLTTSDPRFHSGDYIYFRIRVKNTSSVSINNITAKDWIPSYIEPVEGPGTYDGKARTVTWDAGSFGIGEEKFYTFKMQIDSPQYLPADKGLFCLINKAEAGNGTVYNSDTAQFCVEKQVTNVVTTPKAGPEFAMLIPLFSLLTGSIGIWIKKKAS